jgi:hypothetical protein
MNVKDAGMISTIYVFVIYVGQIAPTLHTQIIVLIHKIVLGVLDYIIKNTAYSTNNTQKKNMKYWLKK